MWSGTPRRRNPRADWRFLDITYPITYYRRMSRADVRKAILPAAGLGTRFLPATKASPKEMLPLVDKPLIQYAVEESVASGIESILIITGRDKSTIENHFDISFELEHLLLQKGKEELFGVIRAISAMARISYTRQREALGLGHAIYQGRDFTGDEPFAALLAD